MRGFFIGLSWGAIVGAVTLSVLSLWGTPPGREGAVIARPVAPVAETPPSDAPPRAPLPETGEASSAPLTPAPVQAPTPATESAAFDASQDSSAPKPQAAQSELSLPAGSEFNRPPPDQVPTLSEAERAATPREGAPAEAAIAAQAPIPVPPRPDTQSAAAPEAQSDSAPRLTAPDPFGEDPAPADLPGAPAAEPAAEPLLQTPAETPPETPPETPVEALVPDTTVALVPTPAESPSTASDATAPPAVLDQIQAPPAARTRPPAAQTLEALRAQTQTGGEGSAAARLPGSPVVPLTGAEPSVQTEGAAETPANDPANDPGNDAANAAAIPPALRAHAAPFAGRDGRPVFAVVLIDLPLGAVDRSTLLGFNFPVAIAIDPSRPDAADLASYYRAAGLEVLISADALPAEGRAQDIAVALEGSFGAVPEAVALIDTASGLLQRSPEARATTLEMLRQSGHGLLTFPGGLNPAQAQARRDGVPALSLYRELDGNAERSTVITRYLARAVIHANQAGQSIVVGRALPDTVTALYAWAQSNRTDTVQIVPVSEILRSEGLGN